MKHAATCKICNRAEIVNGLKQIDEFKARHQHGQAYTEYITGANVELDNKQDRIDLKIDPPELITGSNTASVRDYWRKVPGAI